MSKESNTHIVIGSGPSGVSCAHALLAQGCAVVMLDAGNEIEAEKKERIDRMAAAEPMDWSEQDRAGLVSEIRPDSSGLVDKLHFGSDYIYRDSDSLLGITRKNVGIKASLAKGGLSNVWGSAMMPTCEYDMKGWPITYQDLEAHYKAVAKFAPISARKDGLESRFPLGTDTPLQLRLSQQAQKILSRLDRSRRKLEKGGFFHGYSRVAIQGSRNDVEGCRYCGFCMYGCPYGYIYTSANTVDNLLQHPRFSYRKGFLAQKVSETKEGASVDVLEIKTGNTSRVNASRVFVAGGPLPTAAILMRSLHLYDIPITMLDSQYFVLPLLMLERVKNVRAEAFHTMSQLFLEFIDPHLGGNASHLQIYTCSDFLARFVKLAFGPFAKPLDRVTEEIENRLAVVQAFMHSNDSGSMTLLLKRESKGTLLTVSPNPLPRHTKKVIRTICVRLLKSSLQTGFIPLLPKLEVPNIGRSFHSGGTFPMASHPKGFESDMLGRPMGLSRIHAVDSSVLPTIPGTTITFPIMANAHRIGTEAAMI